MAVAELLPQRSDDEWKKDTSITNCIHCHKKRYDNLTVSVPAMQIQTEKEQHFQIKENSEKVVPDCVSPQFTELTYLNQVSDSKEEGSLVLQENHKSSSKSVSSSSLCCLTVRRQKAVKKWPPKYTKLNLYLGITVFITFSVDYVTDIQLMLEYIADGDYFLFTLTCGFIVVPSLISGIISIVWYSLTFKRDQRLGYNHAGSLYIARIIVSFLQLGRLFRQAEFIYCVFKSLRLQRTKNETSEEKRLRERASEEKRDAATLALIDGFMESALQLVLQLHLTISLNLPATFPRVSSLLSSWVSTGVIVTSYYRSVRKAHKYKQNVDFFSAVSYFLWRFTGLGPRYLLLAIALTYFKPWCFILIPAHTLFVFILYLISESKTPDVSQITSDSEDENTDDTYSKSEEGDEKSNSKRHRCVKNVFVLLMSFVGIFTFINMKGGGSWKISCAYYVIYYVENILTAVIILCMSNSNDVTTVWTNALWALPIGLILHLITLAVYYRCFHPKHWNENAIRIEIRCCC